MKTVIMAGGKGKRISDLFPDIPKPLIPIGGKPVLEWELESLRDQGFKDIIITVSHMHEKIEQYFGDGREYGVNIQYFIEDRPLGNAGALFKIRDSLQEDFLLLNADAMFDVNFQRFVDFHYRKGGLATLFTHPNSHPYDSGLILANDDGSVEQWLTKEEARPKYYKNRVNAGLHVISPKVIDNAIANGIDPERIGRIINGKAVTIDLDRQLLKPLCGLKKVYCYDSPEYVKDMGTPERFYSVENDFNDGIVHQKNLSNKQKAIFLDRDGTINQYVGFLTDINDFSLMEGVGDAIRKINGSGYLAIVITNQPVVARGEVTEEELRNIHNKMETELGKIGAYLDGIYYCPHHPHKGFKGEIPELKVECECRKPKPGMLLKASEDFNIDLSSSWMIGDGENDIKAGKNAGCHTALITSDVTNENDAEIVSTDLLSIINRII